MDTHQEQIHVFQSKLCDDLSDEDYFTFVAYLSEWTKQELEEVRGDAVGEKQALCRYYKRGERAQLTPGELIDFLAVDGSNIIEEAGYSYEECLRLMEISDRLTDAEIYGIDLPEDIGKPQKIIKPSIIEIEETGYDEAEGDRLMAISDSLTEEEIANIDLLEDTEEPPESDQLKFDI
jgi:hypothetical protein